jgi:DNA-binding MarR family transcriptional regulator
MAAAADPERLAVWRSFRTTHAVLDRALAHALVDERELPLPWFEVLVALQAHGGKRRVMDLADDMVLSPSSLSRQLGRMEDEGLVRRERGRPDDLRAVVAIMTREGRDTYRRANSTYMRVVKKMFLGRLAESEIATLQRAFAKVLDGA